MSQKTTVIISAFPGVGKTHFKNNCPEGLIVLDSDSSLFSWVEKDGNKVRNPEFPSNYINYIKSQVGKVDFILVSSHKEVREALFNEGIIFNLVVPNPAAKQHYMERYKQRGSPEAFINIIDAGWDKWIEEVMYQEGCNLTILPSSKYLSDYVQDFIGKIAEPVLS